MNIVTLSARNVLRNKGRTTLTILAMVVAIVAFVLLRTVLSAYAVYNDVTATDRLIVRHKVSSKILLPKRYADAVGMVSGVKVVNFGSMFWGQDPKVPKLAVGTVAIDGESFLSAFQEVHISPEDKTRWLGDRRGIVVGETMARKHNLKVGDEFTVQVPGGQSFSFNVDGIFTSSRLSFSNEWTFCHFDYVTELGPERDRDQVQRIVALIDDPGRTAEISAAIDKALAARGVPSSTMSEKALQLSSMAGVSTIMDAVEIATFIIVLIMLMILANTVAMGVRERTSEYGVLRALGFGGSSVALFVLGEALTIGVVGGVLGAAAAYPIVDRGMGRWLTQNTGGLVPYFHVDAATLVTAIVVSLVAAVVAGAVPAYSASRLSVIDALRRIG